MFRFSIFAVNTVIVTTLSVQYAQSDELQLTFITQYCNEAIATADIDADPRMLRNISNSLMTEAPDYLDGAIYLQRRSNMVNLCPELDGIGEVSQDWLRDNRVSVSKEAVVVAAVREEYYPGAGALLTGLGWTPLNETITLNYVAGVAQLPLYAGLVPPGPVGISGSGVNDLNIVPDEGISSHYFFFQETGSFAPEVLSQLQTVPEPGSMAIVWSAVLSVLPLWLSRRSRRRRALAT